MSRPLSRRGSKEVMDAARLRYKLAHPDRVVVAEAKYRASEKGQAAELRAKVARPPGMHAAHVAVNRAIDSGRLAPQPCRDCGTPKAQAHHHRGYAREFQLDVVWLCPRDHKLEHQRLSGTPPPAGLDALRLLQLVSAANRVGQRKRQAALVMAIREIDAYLSLSDSPPPTEEERA